MNCSSGHLPRAVPWQSPTRPGAGVLAGHLSLARRPRSPSWPGHKGAGPSPGASRQPVRLVRPGRGPSRWGLVAPFPFDKWMNTLQMMAGPAHVIPGFALVCVVSTACTGSPSGPVVTVTTTVTATPSGDDSEPAASSDPFGDALPFGHKPGGETYPGLWISVSAPKRVRIQDAYPKTRGRMIVVSVTQSNSTTQTINVESGATEAHVRGAQKPCVQLFAQRPHLEANATGAVLPRGRRTFLVGFACDGKPGDLLTVTSWAQDPKIAARTHQNPGNVTFVGQMP